MVHLGYTLLAKCSIAPPLKMNYPIQWLHNFHSTKQVNFWTFHHCQQCVLGHKEWYHYIITPNFRETYLLYFAFMQTNKFLLLEFYHICWYYWDKVTSILCGT